MKSKNKKTIDKAKSIREITEADRLRLQSNKVNAAQCIE